MELYSDFEMELDKAYKNQDEVVYRRGYEDGKCSSFKPSKKQQIKVLEDVLDENDLYQWQRIAMRELVDELKKYA